MAINLDGANAYFSIGNHVNAQTWLKFTDDARAGAVASARRAFERELARPLRDDEPPYSPEQRRRDDFAVYEQALWMLLGSPYGDGDAGDALSVLQGDAAPDYNGRRERFSQEALRWLGWGGVTFVRG